MLRIDFSIRARRALCVGILAAFALHSAPISAATTISIHKVALTGEPAPGTEDGTVFSFFTTALNHDIMHPVIDDAGHVAFIALLAGPAVNNSNRSGIWSEATGTLGLVVRTGMPAPGTPPGVVFSGVPNEYIPFPPNFAAGQVAFTGELSGPGVDFSNRNGVWAQQAGQIVLIARNNDPAPGLPAGVRFGSTGLLGIDDSGHTQLFASLTGPGITTANNDSIWSNRSGALVPLVREGDPAPGTPPGVVIGLGVFGTASTFPAIAFNDQSRLFVAANLLGSGVNTFNDEALFLENEGGNLTLLAREGDPAPTGQPGVTYGGGVLADFDSLQINALGQIVFTCRLGGSMPTTFAVFTTHTGTLAPLSPPAEAGSSIFGAPILSDAGKLALVVSLPDNEPGYPVTLGIWWDQPGALTPLVRPGDTVAGPSGDLTVTSAGQIVGFSATGLLAFRAYLQGDAEYPQHNLLLADAGCGLHRVIGNGDLFDVAGDGSDLREVLRIVTGGLAANGTVAFRLDFTDNSSGHFSARLALAGDADSDGDIDLSDHAALAACLTGPGAGPPAANCTALDFEPDADIDLRDTAAFFNIFTGP